MAAFQFINYVPPACSSFYFADSVNNKLNVLGNADFAHQVLPFQSNYGANGSIYLAPWLDTDPITILLKTNCDLKPTINICDVHQKVIAAATSTLNAAPYYKGSQTVAGDIFPGLLGVPPTGLKSTLWAGFTFGQFSLPPGIYYIQIVISSGGGSPVLDTIYSEPINVYTSAYDYWDNQANLRNTLFFQSQYNSNRSQNTNCVVTNWFDDYPSNTTPYFPTFTTRCEGFILPYDMKLINQGYLIQNYQQLAITGQQIPQRVLKIGENSLGIPDYMLEKVTEFLISDACSITGDSTTYYQYKLWNPSGQPTPGDLWKTKRNDAYPLLSATCPLTLGSLAQQFMINPIAVPPTGEYSPLDYDPSEYTT